MSSNPAVSGVPLLEAGVQKCPECKSIDIILDHQHGKTVCSSCGMVVDDQEILEESEWRTFSSDKGDGVDRNRVGGPENPMSQEDGLSTTMDFGGDSDYLSKWQRVIGGGSKTSVAMQDGFSDIYRIGGTMGLTQTVVLAAKELFREAMGLQEMKGRDRSSIATAAIFFACRQAGNERTVRELCAIAGTNKKKVGKVISKLKLVEAMGKHIKRAKGAPIAPQGYELLTRFCSNLNLEQKAINIAKDVSEKVAKIGVLAGRTPAVIASACILLTTSTKPEYQRSEQEVASVCGISEFTARKAVSLLYPYKDELLAGISM